MDRVYNVFGSPKHVPPSALVRRWDEIAMVGAGAALLIGLIIALPLLAMGAPVGTDLLRAWWALTGDPDSRALLSQVGGWGVVALVTLPALLAGGWAAVSASTPRTHRVHVQGTRLVEGPEAIAQARSRSCDPELPLAMRLHPDYLMEKRVWAQHVLLLGGVGAGKTTIMGPWLDHIIRNRLRCFIYDVKGDITSRYLEPVLITPYDSRSYVWSIAEDCLSASDADLVAEQLVPIRPGESNPFFPNGARMILSSLLRMLQATKGRRWTWQDLRDACLLSAEAKLEVLKKYHPMASIVLSDPTAKSATDLMSTVAVAARMVDALARAWTPEMALRDGRKRTFSIRRWIRDDYKGRPQVIVQGGGPADLTSAYIGAMVNIAASAICSGELPDNEQGRFLGFFLDEIVTAGKIDTRLFTLGRSKGVVMMAASQAPELLETIYEKSEADAIQAACKTKIYGAMGSGPTRDKIAEHAGRNRMAALRPDQAFEESDQILRPTDLTNKLGFKKATMTVTAILDQGGDLLMLDWPVVTYPKRRDEQVPGVLMLPPAREQPKPTPPAPEQEQVASVTEVLERLQQKMAQSRSE